MSASKRLNLAAMRAAGVLFATIKWTWDDVIDVGGETLLALIEVVGNALQLVFTVVVGPFLMFRKAWGLRKHIKEDSTWTKRRRSPTE